MSEKEAICACACTCIGAIFATIFIIEFGGNWNSSLYDPSSYLKATCVLVSGNETLMYSHITKKPNGQWGLRRKLHQREDPHVSMSLYMKLHVRVYPKNVKHAPFDASGNNCGITDWANNCGELSWNHDADKWINKSKTFEGWSSCDRDPWCDVSIAVSEKCIATEGQTCQRFGNESTPATRWCDTKCVKNQCSNHTLPVGRKFACWYDGERNFQKDPSIYPPINIYAHNNYHRVEHGRRDLGVRFASPSVKCDFPGKYWSGGMVVIFIISLLGSIPILCCLCFVVFTLLSTCVLECEDLCSGGGGGGGGGATYRGPASEMIVVQLPCSEAVNKEKTYKLFALAGDTADEDGLKYCFYMAANEEGAEVLCTFKSHSDAITCLAFSNDSRQIFSVSKNGELKQWNSLGELKEEKVQEYHVGSTMSEQSLRAAFDIYDKVEAELII